MGDRAENGEIVYFPDEGRVGFGIRTGYVDSFGQEYVDLIELADHRHVNGIPIDKFSTEEEWHPLPKGWTYNTELFALEDRTPDSEIQRMKQLRIDRPEDIRAGLLEEILVMADTAFHGVVEAEIDRNKGYRIVKKYPHWTVTYGSRPREYVRIRQSELFSGYYEAKQFVDAKEAEKKRIQGMSDYEWSLMEIEKVLRRIPEPSRTAYRNVLIRLPDLWDLEVRIRDGAVEYRWFEKKTPWVQIRRK